MKNIFIWWIQGVWKSTIVNKIVENNNFCSRFSFGEEMKIVWESQIENYKWIQYLSENERKFIIKHVYKKLDSILEAKEKDFLFFDNHFTVLRWHKIENAFWDNKVQLYNSLIVLTAQVSSIVQRIIFDWWKERVDSATKTDFIQLHQDKEIKRATFLSKIYNIPILEVENKTINHTIKQVEDFIF